MAIFQILNLIIVDEQTDGQKRNRNFNSYTSMDWATTEKKQSLNEIDYLGLTMT